MNRLLHRFMPSGLAARFALLLAAALIIANLVAVIVLSLERTRLGRQALEDQEIERIVALVPGLEAVEHRFRKAVARKASTRVARISVEPVPVVKSTQDDDRSQALARRLSSSLPDRTIQTAIVSQTVDWRRSQNRHGDLDQQMPRSREMIAVSIELDVAQSDVVGSVWLNVITRGGGRPGNGIQEEVFLLVLGLSLIAVLGVGLWFIRHLTQPLLQLAIAAKAAGQGDRRARVEESGAREMREAAASFNVMQGQLARFDEERMRTMAAVGHDLRTPITSLRIRAEMLDPDSREGIIRTLDEMTVMADGLVAFARGHNDVEQTTRLDLTELLGHLCEQRGARFEAGPTLFVVGRPVGLSRAIGNVIDNAIRYGDEATVQASSNADNIEITVSDKGQGIPAERLSDVFEPFVRGEQSRNTDTGGAGLGLSIARTILQSHGGSIKLANQPEGGLLVTISLPAALSE